MTLERIFIDCGKKLRKEKLDLREGRAFIWYPNSLEDIRLSDWFIPDDSELAIGQSHLIVSFSRDLEAFLLYKADQPLLANCIS